MHFSTNALIAVMVLFIACKPASLTDGDGDGFSVDEADCDDGNAAINPSATDQVGDGIDQNCDGLDGTDGDGDGDASLASAGGDCDDADPAMSSVDGDGDGYAACDGDCEDADPAIGPDAVDICDALDNDCNGLVDDHFGEYDELPAGFACAPDVTDWTCRYDPASNSVFGTLVYADPDANVEGGVLAVSWWTEDANGNTANGSIEESISPTLDLGSSGTLDFSVMLSTVTLTDELVSLETAVRMLDATGWYDLAGDFRCETYRREAEETGDLDGDQDNDGSTVGEGDCDDDDVEVSPMRNEEQGDGKDNDCDGRTDEAWSGVTVGRVDAGGSGALLQVDTIGRATALSIGTCAPYSIDSLRGGGWVLANGTTHVAVVDASGSCTDIADFSGTDSGEVSGVAVGADGTIYAVQPDALVSVALDGTLTRLASWSLDEFDANGLAADLATGQLGIFGTQGGFATYDATDGFVLRLAPDPALRTFAGAHKDGGGWYVPAENLATGEYALYAYDPDGMAWVEETTWTDGERVPYMLAVDGDSDSFFVSATGSPPLVWRVAAFTSDFYETRDSDELFGIAVAYTYE